MEQQPAKTFYDWGANSTGSEGETPEGAVRSASFERNNGPIFDVLKEQVFPLLLSSSQQQEERGKRMLEIGSGTGQHMLQWSIAYPDITFLPSEITDSGLRSITAWCRSRPNVALPPLEIDLMKDDYSASSPKDIDAVIGINLLHIAPIGALVPFVKLCADAQVVAIYGPFSRDLGRFTTDSNKAFHERLQQQDPAMGLRDIERDVLPAFDKYAPSLRLAKVNEMPANNFMLVFQKK